MPTRKKRGTKQKEIKNQSGGANLTARKIDVKDDVIGRDQIINNLIRGFDELLTRHDGEVRNFLEYYLGIEENPAPFDLFYSRSLNL